MIVVAQRVREASVLVDGETVGAIDGGLCLLACALETDGDAEVLWLADKVVDLRLFADEEGRTNRSLAEVGGAALVVPQFTLAADWRKGRRPSFTRAASPEVAEVRLETLAGRLRSRSIPVAHGRFGAMMEVRIVNDGPFTLVLDSAAMPTSRGSSGPSARP